MYRGWVKIHRKIWDNPIVTKDPDYLSVWIYLLTNATHKNHDVLWRGKRITLKPGQLITGRKRISLETKVCDSKVKRIIKDLKSDQQIDQQATSQGSLITIVNWDKYQVIDQQNDQRVTSERPTSDQRVTTIQECKRNIRMCNNDSFDVLKSEKLSPEGRAKWMELRKRAEMMKKGATNE